MKDIKSYIESGVLELYILGGLSDEEKLEVERLADTHPEIRSELLAIENALESFAHSQQMSPAPGLRKQILDKIPVAGEDINTRRIAQAPGITFYKYAFAACLALLFLSWAALFILYGQLNTSRQEIAVLQSSNQKFSNRVNQMSSQLETSLEVLNDPDYRVVRLLGTKASPESHIAVAFNSKSRSVLLDLSGLKMPPNDSDHQYQLWAIVNGQPVDLGIFDVNNDSTGLKRMRGVDKPQAFAVTLEKRGGSRTPTMVNMMVIGNI